MGTDIHCYLERNSGAGWALDPGHEIELVPESDKHYVSEIQSLAARNYELFGIIAGVRNWRTRGIIAPPRGLPKDVCSEISTAFSLHEYHSATYLSPRELETAFKRLFRHSRYSDYPYSKEEQEQMFQAPGHTAFVDFGCNAAILNYIRSYQDNEKMDNILLGLKKKTRFRVIIGFDS